jgi:hypothetical protein
MEQKKDQDIDRRVLLAGVGGAVAAAFLTGNANAGSLEPPPGPVASNRASFSRISAKIARTTSGLAEPRTPVQSLPSSASALHVISAPGSYYLTENIQGVSGLHGIQILSSDVQLDLGGFHLYGAPPDATGLPGGSAIVSSAQNVTVFDGTLIGWQNGIDFSQAALFIVWDVTSIGAVSGAFLLGDRGQAYDCDAYSTGGTGFAALGVRSLVEECGAWTCGVGFHGGGASNIFLSNCATECQSAFEIAQGCSYGPIVVVAGGGDISAIPGSSHPSANLVY